MASSDSQDGNMLSRKLEKEIARVKYKAFGKVKEGYHSKAASEILNLNKTEENAVSGSVDVVFDEAVLKVQRDQLESKVDNLRKVRSEKG